MKVLLKKITTITLVLLTVFFCTDNLYAQNNVAYSISPNCNRISGKSWRCCGTIVVHGDGKITSSIQTSSNRWQGFTGAMRIQFKNTQKVVIYEVVTPSYGVNGESSRTNQWSTTIPKWVVENSHYASVEGIHTSSNSTMQYIWDRGRKYLNNQTGNQYQF